MNPVSSSFRDPSGRVFISDGEIYRTISKSYRPHFEKLISSGLYQELVDKGWLVAHEDHESIQDAPCWKTIKPHTIPFISYPYEWSFSQLKDAALRTLGIQKKALEKGMQLKDASAFNIQFENGKAIFIDTLSFEIRDPGTAWPGYGQFCRHFLAPLALMQYTDISLLSLFKQYTDGIPLELASRLLPRRTRFSSGLYLHIHLHAKLIKKYATSQENPEEKAKAGAEKNAKDTAPALIDSLISLVKSFRFPTILTEWGDYYNNTNYTDKAFESKKEIVNTFIRKLSDVKIACDLGANDGTFSEIAATYAATVISADIDPISVEKNYLRQKKEKQNIVPVLQDLSNPSSDCGWANREWKRFDARCNADVVMGLGLIHHICISNNVPLEFAAEYFASLGQYAIVEFVPKEDSKVQILLATREDIFPRYTIKGFENAFKQYFEIVEKENVVDSHRMIYLMKKW